MADFISSWQLSSGQHGAHMNAHISESMYALHVDDEDLTLSGALPNNSIIDCVMVRVVGNLGTGIYLRCAPGVLSGTNEDAFGVVDSTGPTVMLPSYGNVAADDLVFLVYGAATPDVITEECSLHVTIFYRAFVSGEVYDKTALRVSGR